MSAFLPWRILHLDVRRPLPSLERVEGEGGIQVFYWCDSVPLGSREFPAPTLPVLPRRHRQLAVRTIAPAVGSLLLGQGFAAPLPTEERMPPAEFPDFEQVRQAREPLARLLRSLQEAPSGDPAELSVIVCTRDRPEPLADCLAALLRADQPPEQVIVVDNAPKSDATQRVCESFPGIEYVLEPRPGLSVARNTGVRRARCELIAFTDDDVIVHPTWARRVRSALQADDILAVTGQVLPASLASEAEWIFEKEFGGFSPGFRPLLFDAAYFARHRRAGVAVWRIGAGANMAFRRRAFEEVGLFDERLGAGSSGCSEDSELWYRLLAHGWRCRYDPTTVVYHHHRSDLDTLHRQVRLYLRGHACALLVQFERFGHAGNLYRLLVTLPFYYLRRSLRVLLGRSKRPPNILSQEIRGWAAGIAYYFRNRSLSSYHPLESSPAHELDHHSRPPDARSGAAQDAAWRLPRQESVR